MKISDLYENSDNANTIASSGAFGKSFDKKHNKYNTPNTDEKDGQDGKKKGAMPGMVE